MLVNCENCGEEINRKPSQITRAEHTTCSKKCATSLLSKLSKIDRTCPQCDTNFTTNASNPKVYCSRSCAATANNIKRGAVKAKRICIWCKGDIPHTGKIYCNQKCQHEHAHAKWVEQYKIDWIVALSSNIRVKKYISDTKGYKCECCGISEWQSKPITLELDHIDGNSENNHENNLRLLCPNCHTQTDTYGAKNKGNGRKVRRDKRRVRANKEKLPQL